MAKRAQTFLARARDWTRKQCLPPVRYDDVRRKTDSLKRHRVLTFLSWITIIANAVAENII